MMIEHPDLTSASTDSKRGRVLHTSRYRRGLRVGERRVCFTFNGHEFEGQAGDTAASALLQSGVRLFARSIKFRRPRGILTAGIEEPSALLTVGAVPKTNPNVPAPIVQLYEGIQLRSQNGWPSLERDLLACMGLGGRLFSAGFYYKTFKWPTWRMYEPFIRRLAGLGCAPELGDVSAASVEHLDCDVLVVGAGPAGLEAACASSAAGARVVLCEREPVCGGELDIESAAIDGVSQLRWLTNTLKQLARQGVRILTETAVVGRSGGLWIAHRYAGDLLASHGVYRIRATIAIIATGAIEHGIVFEDNDRPGAMLLGAAEKYLARYGVIVGARPVLFGNHERLYAAAARFLAAGVRIAAIVDTRPASSIDTDRRSLQQDGVTCFDEHVVLRAIGRRSVRGAIVAPRNDLSRTRSIACDALLVSGGWSPSRLANLLQGDCGVYRISQSDNLHTVRAPTVIICGAAAGRLELDIALTDGSRVGRFAADLVRNQQHAGRRQHLEIQRDSVQSSAKRGPRTDSEPTASRAGERSRAADAIVGPRSRGDPNPGVLPFWRSPCSLAAEKRQFVDFQNDVTVSDLRQAMAEGFLDIEHIKRYTTLGVGTEQGGTSTVVGAGIVAEISGSRQDTSRMSRVRPPVQPVMLATLAHHRRGPTLRPERHTPLHEWHVSHGGVLEPMSLWMRPRYYRESGVDARTAGIAEARRVRERCGICDASTLGKIEFAGRSAPEFLDRLYLSRISTMPVGRSRYAVLLREDGMVLDDGIMLRLGEDRFLATVSSNHAELVLSHVEFWRDAEFGTKDVAIADLTDAWSVIVVAGPASRGVLTEALGPILQHSLAALKHMDFMETKWRLRALRVLRASFSGELAFELHCHPLLAMPLWERLIACGATSYGLEAMDILRLEKGYLVSTEINGQTTPHDLNLAIPAGRSCIGSELLDRAAFHESVRPRLVGVQSTRSADLFSAGAQLVELDRALRPCGYISSAAYSPALGRQVGLAFVARHVRVGTELTACEPLYKRKTRVRLTSPTHFDLEGKRLTS
jgi:glycine cleavage system aminomethyltransferase T/NADPH-dependent 2,4-dienoyl-CoA reductase/sulfur reductase-like enzyme